MGWLPRRRENERKKIWQDMTDRTIAPAKLLSVNVGLPREIAWQGRLVRTSIFKPPADGPVRVTRLGLVGDEQSDRAVHGGIDKAVYVYPSEHYPFWRENLPDLSLPWGAFGENLTTEGLLENAVRIGDRLREEVELLIGISPARRDRGAPAAIGDGDVLVGGAQRGLLRRKLRIGEYEKM